MISAKIIADSVSLDGARITTFELQYPRFIHGEVMTHRVFSRNAMSSRAIPVAKMLEQIRKDPAMPSYWGANQPGMQAKAELVGRSRDHAIALWRSAANEAANTAEVMQELGLHKQVANRILEPFQWMRTIVTATEWSNFFALRAHPDAQPEFQVLAREMLRGRQESVPELRPLGNRESSWHLPYVSDTERACVADNLLPKLSAARCARVSYLTHDGERPDTRKDMALFDRLVGAEPLHASPIEHQARTAADPAHRSNNFVGWVQYRQIYEQSLG